MPIDYSKYPPDWEERRARILKRAGNRCEWCGAPNYTTKENGTKVVLTIAHMDHDSENWNVSDDRLKALCQACHLGYDRWRHIAKRKYGMDFFKTQKTLF